MMQLFFKTVFVFLLCSQAALAAGKYATLDAEEGNYDRADISDASTEGAVKVLIHFETFRHGSNWPPTANVGFYQGGSRDHSIQFMLMHRHEGDKTLGIGYRYLVNGKVEKVEAFLDTNVDAGPVEFRVSYKNGVFTLCVNGKQVGSVATELSEVTPFISVASGVARFEINT